MCIPLPTVVSVTFYSERRIRNAQIISRRLVVASLSDLYACFFFFSFSVFSFFPPSVHRGLIIDYRSLSKTSFQLTRNAYFIFIDGCRFQSGTRHFASLLSFHPILFPFSLSLSRFGLPVTLKLSRGCCRNLTRKIVDDTGPVIHGMTDRSSDAPSRFPPLVVVIEPVVDPRQNIANQPLARR